MKQVLVMVLFALGSLGCASGPNYLSRKVDDWQNKDYVENPLKTAVITDVLPGYLILKLGAGIADWLFLNPSQFWLVDVWRGEGAGFDHDSTAHGHKAWFQKGGD